MLAVTLLGALGPVLGRLAAPGPRRSGRSRQGSRRGGQGRHPRQPVLLGDRQLPPCRRCVGSSGSGCTSWSRSSPSPPGAVHQAVRWYVPPLALSGGRYLVYHGLIERYPSLESGSCDPLNPCSIIWVERFGYFTIPTMALSGFAFIAVLLLLPKEIPDPVIRLPRHAPAGRQAESHPVPSDRRLAAAVLVASWWHCGRWRGDGDNAATDSGNADPATTGTVTVSGNPLPQFTDTTGDPGVGHDLPHPRGPRPGGEPMTIGADGRPTMIVFVAHWCPHCQREVPVVQQWVDDGRLPEGVDLAPCPGHRSPAPQLPARRWLADEG